MRGHTTENTLRRSRARREHFAEDQLIELLEPDQLVTVTSAPVPRAVLTSRVRAVLWALRIFALLLTTMVIFTFISELT